MDATKMHSVAAIDEKAPARLQRRRRRGWSWPMRVVVLLLGAAIAVLVVRGSKASPILVETATVRRGVVVDEVSSSSAGEVSVEQHATVRSELSARVMKIVRQKGERAKAGELVILLKASDLDAKVGQARVTVAVQRAQLVQATAHADAARRTAERLRRLAVRGAETGKSADDAEDQLREADAAAEVARGQLEQAVAALQVAKVARAAANLTAPFDGLVTNVFVDVGDEAQVGAKMFDLMEDSRLHVEAALDEADIGRVAIGQPASLRLDALSGHAIRGHVSKLDPTVRKDDKGARSLTVEVEIDDVAAARAAGVRPGMSANVDIRVAEKPDVPNLPSNVIVGAGAKRTVYRIQDGRARQVPVRVGLASWDRSEILSGLAEGDQVIATLNAKGLVDGAAVVTSKAGGR